MRVKIRHIPLCIAHFIIKQKKKKRKSPEKNVGCISLCSKDIVDLFGDVDQSGAGTTSAWLSIFLTRIAAE